MSLSNYRGPHGKLYKLSFRKIFSLKLLLCWPLRWALQIEGQRALREEFGPEPRPRVRRGGVTTVGMPQVRWWSREGGEAARLTKFFFSCTWPFAVDS